MTSKVGIGFQRYDIRMMKIRKMGYIVNVTRCYELVA